jgi:hypothetical protein
MARPYEGVARRALSVVTSSVRGMPSMYLWSQLERVETSRFDPVDAPAKEVAEESERDLTTHEGCPCDECQAPSRDEMWSRWA